MAAPGEILGYGAVVDLVVIAALVAIVARRAWVSISALALDKRGYGQNSAARQRADELVADGYTGYMSGHTHHPELPATATASTPTPGRAPRWSRGSTGCSACPRRTCATSRSPGWRSPRGQAELVSARVELPGATRMERFVATAATRTPTLRCGSPPGRPDPTGRPRTRRPTARRPAGRNRSRPARSPAPEHGRGQQAPERSEARSYHRGRGTACPRYHTRKLRRARLPGPPRR